MLENIIGHAAVVGTLRDEVSRGRFPRAVLFAGAPYTGKLSTALEVARALTCEGKDAAWSCTCASCVRQKDLTHPHTLLLGWRYAELEIAACADTLVRSRRGAAAYLFLRAVRKLTRRFDTAVLDSEDSRVKGAQEKAARLEELVQGLDPAAELPSESALAALAEKVKDGASALAAHLRPEGAAVGQVRMLASWAHVTAGGARKIAIIENADRMQDSARNALLKLLEEPPDAVHLFLLASRRAAIIPTILSRLRPYAFEPRSAAEEREVLSKIFRMESPGEGETLRGFFLGWKTVTPEVLVRLADGLLRRAREEAPAGDAMADLTEILPERGGAARASREMALSFLEETAARMRGLLREGIPLDVLEEWREAAREAQARIEVLNMSPAACLEALYLRMRGAWRFLGAAAAAGAGMPPAGPPP